jgi:hypothetical protein
MYTCSSLYSTSVHVSRHFHPHNAISFRLFKQQHRKRRLSCSPVVPKHVEIDACHHTKARKQPPNSPPCNDAMQSFLVPWFRNNNSWSHDKFYFTIQLFLEESVSWWWRAMMMTIFVLPPVTIPVARPNLLGPVCRVHSQCVIIMVRGARVWLIVACSALPRT